MLGIATCVVLFYREPDFSDEEDEEEEEEEEIASKKSKKKTVSFSMLSVLCELTSIGCCLHSCRRERKVSRLISIWSYLRMPMLGSESML